MCINVTFGAARAAVEPRVANANVAAIANRFVLEVMSKVLPISLLINSRFRWLLAETGVGVVEPPLEGNCSLPGLLDSSAQRNLS